MSGIFDDPEVRAEMQRLGVQHKPGLAREMLDELAPLLAAEGVDLDDLDASDLDRVNEVLANAAERHNLVLFTPVGVHRTGALATLHRFTLALGAGDTGRAASVLAEIQPEPDGDTPAISHVIGVSAGLLDEWLGSGGAPSVRMPRWRGAARSAATDLVALGRKARGFDAIGSLHRRYSGLDIFEGGALAVAATLTAIAVTEGAEIAEVAARMLGAAASSPDEPAEAAASSAVDHPAAPARPLAAVTPIRPSAGGGRRRGKQGRGRSGNPARRGVPPADRAVLRRFGPWLAEQPVIVAPSVDDEVSMMEVLFALARAYGLDAHEPIDVGYFAELILDDDDDEVVDAQLGTLRAYVQFQCETAADVPAWEDAREALADITGENDGPGGILMAAVRTADQVPEDVRRDAFAGLRIVGAVTELLDWMGKGRAATPTGLPRRTDIERVAGMLGISAIGVDREPRAEDAPGADQLVLGLSGPRPDAIRVMSAKDIPRLITWWDALRTTGIIDTAPSRMLPGDAASAWLADDPPAADIAEELTAAYVATVLTDGLEGTAGIGMVPRIMTDAGRLLRLLGMLGADESDLESLDDLPFAARADGDGRRSPVLQLLVDAGALVAEEDGAESVPVVFGGAVARGVHAAIVRVGQFISGPVGRAAADDWGR